MDILAKAYWHVLKAETSCNFYWGSRWVHKAYDDIEAADRLIDQVEGGEPSSADAPSGASRRDPSRGPLRAARMDHPAPRFGLP